MKEQDCFVDTIGEMEFSIKVNLLKCHIFYISSIFTIPSSNCIPVWKHNQSLRKSHLSVISQRLDYITGFLRSLFASCAKIQHLFEFVPHLWHISDFEMGKGVKMNMDWKHSFEFL